MLAHQARITPARSTVLVSSLLQHAAAAPGRASLAHRAFSTSSIRKQREDGNKNNDSSPQPSGTSGANGKDLSKSATTPSTPTTPSTTSESNTALTVPASSAVAAAETETTVTEAERKRAEERDAALKEILESAAAEARSLERERMAEEARRQEALKKKAAEEKARQEELERIKATAIESAVTQESAAEKFSSSTAAATPASSLSATGAEPVPKHLQPESAAEVSKVNAAASAVKAEQSSTTSSKITISHDPLQDFQAKLLPYKKSLQSSTEFLRSSIPDSLRELSDSIKRKDYQNMITQLAKHLNTITGYNAIDDLKRQVISHGDALDASRIKLAQTKHAYEEAISVRSNTQKAINDLLQRKHLWSPNDVIRFTDLYRSEHANEKAEIRAKEAYRHAEEDVEEKSRKLTTVIMERYHGEQVWSDKIRAASTYGTGVLVFVNVMAFLVVQAFVEPRRRRKQIERYEELVQDLTERGILPLKDDTGAANVLSVSPTAAHGSAGSESSVQAGVVVPYATDDKEYQPTAAANSLDGGVDILERLVQMAQEQEARLRRMEAVITGKDAPPAIAGAFSEMEKVEGAEDVVITEDGTILLVNHGDGLETEVDFLPAEAETWPNQLTAASLGRSALHHARPVSSAVGLVPDKSDDQRAWTERVKGLIASNDDPVLMKKRDYWLSGLGGAILGGIVTGLFVLATNR